MKRAIRHLRYVLFSAAVVAFILFYFHELNPAHEWPPRHYKLIRDHLGRYGLVWVNLAMFACFFYALAHRRNARKTWMAHGIFFAFMISLIAEMFGVPLAIYLLSGVGAPMGLGDAYLARFGHIPITLGISISLLSLVLVWHSWRELYRSTEPVVASGIYAHIRHPQYVGLTLFAFGWLLHWPTVPALVLFPFIAGAYGLASLREEAWMLEHFPLEYRAYVQTTGFYLPRSALAKRSQRDAT
jgi:protein-S-isoprenylcysteine O-methyltransferase Ste14